MYVLYMYLNMSTVLYVKYTCINEYENEDSPYGFKCFLGSSKESFMTYFRNM